MKINDANELLAYARAQQSIVERQALSATRDRSDIIYQQFVPVDPGNNPSTQAVTFISSEAAGQAKFLNANADDVPKVDVNYKADVKPVVAAGIGYGWGWQELQNARSLGINLQSDRALAARYAFEDMLQRIAFDGDDDHGMVGLNQVSSSQGNDVSGNITGKWSSGQGKDAAAISKDIITLIESTGGEGEPTANRVILPSNEYTHALTQFFGDSGRTAFDLVRELYPNVRITKRKALETQDGGKKYIAYRFDPTSLVFHVPMALTFLPVWHSGPLRFDVPGLFSVAGINFKRKADVAFAVKS